MDISKVEKHSKGYALLYKYLVLAHNKIFYKKVVCVGRENIPEGEPVVFAPNHQNAAMDALAIIFSDLGQPVFLARSDIFANPFIAKLLLFIKILPVYRIRDGKEKLQFNEEIFKKTVNILEQNKRIAIFPEAQHIDKRHLRAVKKGIQRVSFMFAEQTNYERDVKIVPVGIYYSNYWNFRTTLQVRFGKPISASDYYEQSKQNLQKAILELGKEMQVKIEEQIVHIKDLANYDIYESVREIYDFRMMNLQGAKKFDQEDKFPADKKTIEITEKLASEKPDEFADLCEIVSKYSSGLKEEKLKDWVFDEEHNFSEVFLKIIFLLIAFPFFLFGFLNNFIPYNLPKIITSKLKDKQFMSSITFGFGVFSFPIFYILQTIPVWLLTDKWYYPLAYFLTAPVFGMAAFTYSRFFVKLRSLFKLTTKKNSPKYIELSSLRRKIIEKLDLYSKK